MRHYSSHVTGMACLKTLFISLTITPALKEPCASRSLDSVTCIVVRQDDQRQRENKESAAGWGKHSNQNTTCHRLCPGLRRASVYPSLTHYTAKET